MPHDPTEIHAALHRLAREEGGRVLALLARRFGDLDLADDAVQDALVEANERWPMMGVPHAPVAWLTTVATRKAIDALRRAGSRDRRLRGSAADIDVDRSTDEAGSNRLVRRGGDEMMIDTGGGGHAAADGGDDRLRLMFLCCHPALDEDAQVALTLRLVGGLTTPEIAAAFVVPEATLAQRIVRAKRKVREARIPLTMPKAIDDRLDAILTVLYLVFNEGYLSRGAETDALQRVDLADEAIRLTRLVAELCPDRPEVSGLLALEMYQRARADTRTDRTGDIVLLEDQDRTRWDHAAIAGANAVLYSAMRAMEPGPYQMQALIAARHANAPTANETDWPSIAAAYEQLRAMAPSPVVDLNHAVAVAMSSGPRRGLELVDAIAGLDEYHLFHSTRGDLLRRMDRRAESAVAYRRARSSAANASEQRFLDRRLAELDEG